MIQYTEFTKFTFLSQIGSGAYSTVYKACKFNQKQKKIELFAIKKINNSTSGHSQILNRQICHLLRLSHPNIIQLKGVYSDKTNTYLIMQFMQYDLITFYKKYRKQNKSRLPECIIGSIMHQVCMAVKYLHKDCFLIHRDIKPQNIMINYDNGQVIAKLIDFGFLKKFDQTFKMTPYMVTRWYRPIQIALGLNYDEKIDIFSLGAVFLQMYIGEQIFKSHSNIHQIDLICKICGYPNWKPAIKKLNNLGIKVDPFYQPQIYNIIRNISKQAAELIVGMLQTVPICRYSINQIISHKYFQVLSKPHKLKFNEKTRVISHQKPLLKMNSLVKRSRNAKSSQSQRKPKNSPKMFNTKKNKYDTGQSYRQNRSQKNKNMDYYIFRQKINNDNKQLTLQKLQSKNLSHNQYYDLKGTGININIINCIRNEAKKNKYKQQLSKQKRTVRTNSDKKIYMISKKHRFDQNEQKVQQEITKQLQKPYHQYFQKGAKKRQLSIQKVKKINPSMKHSQRKYSQSQFIPIKQIKTKNRKNIMSSHKQENSINSHSVETFKAMKSKKKYRI